MIQQSHSQTQSLLYWTDLQLNQVHYNTHGLMVKHHTVNCQTAEPLIRSTLLKIQKSMSK